MSDKMTTHANISLKEFALYLRETNPILYQIAGEATVIDACSRFMVLEEFTNWRKMQDYKPALAGEDSK